MAWGGLVTPVELSLQIQSRWLDHGVYWAARSAKHCPDGNKKIKYPLSSVEEEGSQRWV